MGNRKAGSAMQLFAGVRSILERMVAGLVVYPYAMLALRTGRVDTARRGFTWVLRKNRASFAAHVQLGCLYLRLGNRLEALRLLNQARWIDPFRFERLPLPAAIHRMLGRSSPFRARTAPNRVDPGAGWRPTPPSFHEPCHLDGGCVHGRGSRDSHSETKTFRYRDFASMEEYLRFRGLPPISRDEIHAVDWDRLLARLEGEAR